MELDESAEDCASSNRTKLKRITMMIDKEDESMGFLQRGTKYDQYTRRSVYTGYETRERIPSQRDEVEGYDTHGNPVLNHPDPRSESVARGEAWGYDVPCVRGYDNNVRRNTQSIHHQLDSPRQSRHCSRHADDVGKQQMQYNNESLTYLQMGRRQGHSDVGMNPQNTHHTNRRRLPRVDDDGNQVQILDDYHTYYNLTESSLNVDGYESFSDGGSDGYEDPEHVQRGRTPEYGCGDIRRSLVDTRPLGDSRSSHRRRHTEDMERHDELTAQPEVGDGNVASDDDYDTLP